MPPAVSVAILLAACVLALVAMRAGWRHRARRGAAVVPELPASPAADDAALGTPRTAALDATYVSSTAAGDWLDRVVAHDLGVRSSAVVRVFDAGVRIERTGARDLFVPAAALRGARTAPGMAGKFVGRDGLVVITWQVPGTEATALDTGLRLRRGADRTPLIEAVGALVTETSADDPGATPKEHP